MNPSLTQKQLAEATALCRKVFTDKLADYGPSWRILRPQSLTDQIFIKAKRIRSLQEKGGHGMVDEGYLPEFIGIVNYGIIGLIQLELGNTVTIDIDPARAIELYDKHVLDTLTLLTAKNHDYDEAWRSMRLESYVDLILTKVMRTKEIEDHAGHTVASEGIDANYMDMVNYALFGIIRLACDD